VITVLWSFGYVTSPMDRGMTHWTVSGRGVLALICASIMLTRYLRQQAVVMAVRWAFHLGLAPPGATIRRPL